jgi:dolichyl-phosphate-mannose--protein O-mannosyl transferase
MGNPLLWWLGLAAVIVATVKGIQERKPVLIFLVAVYLSQILPYVLVSRDTFIYHYYPEVPILALLVAGLLEEFWAERGSKKYVLLYLAAVGVAFAFFYPAISGVPVQPSYIEHLRLMRAWDFLGV